MTRIIFGAFHVSSGLEVVLQPPVKRTRVTRCATIVGKLVTGQAATDTGYQNLALGAAKSV